jgi:enoyl-CoA hydratase
MKTFVRSRIESEVGSLTLEPEVPGKPPTLDYEVLDGIAGAVGDFAEACGRGELRAVVVASASPKYFVVGANLEALKKIDAHSIGAWVERGHRTFNALADLPVPVIAKVGGYCLGGGFELAMACDFIAASDGARFGLPEAGLGFVPGWGGIDRLAERVGAPRAKELLATGRAVDAAEAYRLGIAAFAGTAAELDEYLDRTLESIRKNSRLAVSLTKIILAAEPDRRARSLRSEAAASMECLSSGDTARRLDEFFKSREKKS